MEALAPVLVDELRLVLDELPAGAHVVVCDPERVRTRAADLVRTSAEFLDASWAAAAGGGTAPVDLGAASLRELDEVDAERAELGLPWWGIARADPSSPTAAVTSSFDAGAGLPRRHRGRADRPARLGRATAGGSRSSSTATARPSARSSGWPAAEIPAPAGRRRRPPSRGVVEVTTGRLRRRAGVARAEAGAA